MRIIYEGVKDKDITIRFKGTDEEIDKLKKAMQGMFAKEKDCEMVTRGSRMACGLEE